jgi:hypothetical protein
MDKGSNLLAGEPCGQEGPARYQEGGLERDNDAADCAHDALAVLGNVLRQGDFSKLGTHLELYLAKAVKVVQAAQDERQNMLRRLHDKEATISGLEERLELHPGNRREDLSKIETLWQSNFRQKSVIADKEAEIDSIHRTLAKAYTNEERRAACGIKELRRLDTTVREMQEELAFYRRIHVHSDAPPPGERLAHHAAASAELRSHLVSMHRLYGERAYRDARRDFSGGAPDSAHDHDTNDCDEIE